MSNATEGKVKRRMFKKWVLFDKEFYKKDFEYIVYKKEKDRVAFLSSQNRAVLPLAGGHTRLDIAVNKELYDEVSPSKYKLKDTASVFKEKGTSKLGVGGLARTDHPRIKDAVSKDPSPGPQTYDIRAIPTSIKLYRYPFNSSTLRENQSIGTTGTPGVNAYDLSRKCNEKPMAFHNSFGGRVTLDPHVHIKCTAKNEDRCDSCGEEPFGDYWYDGKAVLCRPCMKARYKEARTVLMKKMVLDRYKVGNVNE